MALITHPKILTTYNQGENINDFIFPVARAEKRVEDELCYFDYKELIGTAFFIGNRGFALTAGHIVDQLTEKFNPDKEALVARFHGPNSIHHFEIIQLEKHPTDDIGLIKINGSGWQAQIKLSAVHEGPSCEYHCWGYPIDVASEMTRYEPDAQEIPDLIFTKGYIRRRLDRKPITRIAYGTHFYEISELAGQGCSGAPLVAEYLLKKNIGNQPWPVFAIYVSENSEVGYAIRLDEFLDWSPKILGKSIKAEANGE
jgi:hypothetical protein